MSSAQEILNKSGPNIDTLNAIASQLLRVTNSCYVFFKKS